MATITALNVISFLQGQTELDDLLAGGIWLDIAADKSIMPYVAVSTPDSPNTFSTGSDFYRTVKCSIQVFAASLEMVDAIVAALELVLPVGVAITGTSFQCLNKVGPIPKAQLGGAYSAEMSYQVRENAS